MAGIEVDLDYFPLVWIINSEGTTDADYEEMLRRITQVIDRGERFVNLVEGRGIPFPSASQRKRIADWLPPVKEKMQRLSLGTGMVMTNALQRGAITALTWIMRPDVPMVPFETRATALDWCRGRLVETDVYIPAKLHDLFRTQGTSAKTGAR